MICCSGSLAGKPTGPSLPHRTTPNTQTVAVGFAHVFDVVREEPYPRTPTYREVRPPLPVTINLDKRSPATTHHCAP